MQACGATRAGQKRRQGCGPHSKLVEVIEETAALVGADSPAKLVETLVETEDLDGASPALELVGMVEDTEAQVGASQSTKLVEMIEETEVLDDAGPTLMLTEVAGSLVVGAEVKAHADAAQPGSRMPLQQAVSSTGDVHVLETDSSLLALETDALLGQAERAARGPRERRVLIEELAAPEETAAVARMEAAVVGQAIPEEGADSLESVTEQATPQEVVDSLESVADQASPSEAVDGEDGSASPTLQQQQRRVIAYRPRVGEASLADPGAARERLETLVKEGGSEWVVPKYESIRGRPPGLEVASSGSGDRETILDHQTIAQRFLDELQTKTDLTDEEREVIATIRRMVVDNSSSDDEDDVDQPSEPALEWPRPDDRRGRREASSDSEDARDVVVGGEEPQGHLPHEVVQEEAELEEVALNAVVPVTKAEVKVTSRNRAKERRSVHIKCLLDQHAGILTMSTEERILLTNQLQRHLKDWEKREDVRRRQLRTSQGARSRINVGICSPSTEEANLNKIEVDNNISESDDDIDESEVVRNVSKTLEMQIASYDTV